MGIVLYSFANATYSYPNLSLLFLVCLQFNLKLPDAVDEYYAIKEKVCADFSILRGGVLIYHVYSFIILDSQVVEAGWEPGQVRA